jgi:hypothetical protein
LTGAKNRLYKMIIIVKKPKSKRSIPEEERISQE